MTRRDLAIAAAAWLVISTAVAAGIVAGALVILAFAPDAVSASRPAPEAVPFSGDGMTTERLVPLRSPDSRVLAEAPIVLPGPSSPQPTGKRPAATATPRTSSSLRGTATWFRSPSGVSAAGPALRAAVGPDWRGTRVTVCAGGRCVATVLGDWMRADRLIDLHAPLFAQLAPLSRGVLEVTVKW